MSLLIGQAGLGPSNYYGCVLPSRGQAFLKAKASLNEWIINEDQLQIAGPWPAPPGSLFTNPEQTRQRGAGKIEPVPYPPGDGSDPHPDLAQQPQHRLSLAAAEPRCGHPAQPGS
ncbi:hypothetical protein D3C78_1228780 [compost metagenome]